MAGLPKLKQTRSISRYGLSQVTVVFEEGTDIYFARQLVNERIQQVKENLPNSILPEMGPTSTGLGEIFMWTVEAKKKALLKRMAHHIPQWIYERCKIGLSNRNFGMYQALTKLIPLVVTLSNTRSHLMLTS